MIGDDGEGHRQILNGISNFENTGATKHNRNRATIDK